MKDIKKITTPLIVEESFNLISSNLINLLNSRIKAEEDSSRLYLDMSLWLNNEGYKGAAALWKKYSNEELAHADWARSFLLDLGIKPETLTLDSQNGNYKSLQQIVEISYKHEVLIYNQCKALAQAAFTEQNYLLYPLAIKYTNEQTEELGKLQDFLDQLKTFGTEKVALRLLDEEMGEHAK